MGLIDADALIQKCGNWYVEEGPAEGFIGSLDQLLNEQPTIDAVPVVRCRDCKWFGGNWVTPKGSICTNWKLKRGSYGNLWIDQDFYCGYGERIEHGTD